MAETDALLEAWAGRSGTEDGAWAAARPGPPLAAVAARISTVPRDFLDDAVSVRALAGDILAARGDRVLACLPFADDRRVRLGAAIGLWLCASEDVLEPLSPALAAGRVELAIDALALRLAPVADPLDWLADDERREEATRTALLWAGYLPAGEDAATARALLDARDSLQRDRALADALAAHQHRVEIARRLADARAKEAAARYSSE